MPKILVVGSLNADLVIETDRMPKVGETLSAQNFTFGAGGKGANQAVASRRLAPDNVSVAMVGCIGDDELGRKILTDAKKEGIDIRLIETRENFATGVAAILV